MDFLLILLLIILIIYLCRKWIIRGISTLMIRRLQHQFGEQSQEGVKRRQHHHKTPKKEKLSIEEVERRKFDKDQGEYIDFTEERH